LQWTAEPQLSFGPHVHVGLEVALPEPLLARGDGASEQRAAAETAGGSPLGAARWLAEHAVEGV
jgi:hypothetical protein